MKDKLSCEIVRDLLPSYVEGLTSEKTNQAVEEHLESCAACDEMAKRMRTPEPEPEQQNEEVDYLKSIKRRNWMKIVETAVLVAVVVGLLFWGGRHLIGRETDERFVACDITVDGNTVVLSGSFLADGMASGGVSWTEDGEGVVTAQIKWVEPSLFLGDKEIYSQFETSGEVRQVRLGDQILWEDGVSILPTVSRIYAEAHPYIGDMSANGALAEALGIADRLGSFTHELQTTEEPYGWTILLEEGIARENEKQAQEIMNGYSCAMLALVDNLGYVSWEYESENGAQTYTVTGEQATEWTGQSIKLWGRSAAEFQNLMYYLGLTRNGIRELAPMGNSFQLIFELESKQKIFTLELSYGLQDEILSSQGVQHADGSAFEPGEDITFELQEGNFQTGTDGMDLTNFCFTLEAVTEDGTRYTVAEQQRPLPMYGWSYTYTIIDDGSGGLTLRAD